MVKIGSKRPLPRSWLRPTAWLTLSASLAAGSALAQTPDPARLSADLTPVGAERAGTTTGIPAWAPPGNVGAGWSAGKRRMDAFKYQSDKPLFSIDASNVDKYAAQLNPGQVAALKEIKDYRMDVYPTRRTCGIPDFVADNTRRNVGFAKMASDGVTLADAYTPGVPFPLPQTGAEVMWNAKLRYRGVGLEYQKMITAVSPRRGSNDAIQLVADQGTFFPWAVKGGTTFAKVDQVESYTYVNYRAPAALAGQAVTFVGYTAKPSDVFYYFPGQRRVRRMPSYSYDAPQIGFENQYTMDEPYVFAGNLDRFDWKVVGKREMIVPYNSLGMYDFKAKFDEVFQRDFIAPSHRRYELHRVWVVEATVKSGMRHVAPKRTFYIDEDSWSMVGAVDYDAQGKIWKVREGHVVPVYETGTCDSFAFTQFNLSEGRYLIDGSTLGAGSDVSWLVDAAGKPTMRPDYYTSEALRARSER